MSAHEFVICLVVLVIVFLAFAVAVVAISVKIERPKSPLAELCKVILTRILSFLLHI